MDEHLNTHIGQSFEQPHCVNIWTTTLGEYLITHIGWIFEHTHWLNIWTPKLGKHLNTHNAWTFEHIHWKKLWTPTLGEYLNNHIEGTFNLKIQVFFETFPKKDNDVGDGGGWGEEECNGEYERRHIRHCQLPPRHQTVDEKVAAGDCTRKREGQNFQRIWRLKKTNGEHPRCSYSAEPRSILIRNLKSQAIAHNAK